MIFISQNTSFIREPELVKNLYFNTMQLRKQKGYHANNDKIPLFSPLKYYLITIKPQLEKHHIKKIATESTKRHGMFFITTKAFSLIPPCMVIFKSNLTRVIMRRSKPMPVLCSPA
jgi:hypothetical protein